MLLDLIYINLVAGEINPQWVLREYVRLDEIEGWIACNWKIDTSSAVLINKYATSLIIYPYIAVSWTRIKKTNSVCIML